MNKENYKGKTCKELGWKEGDTFKMSVNMDKENFGDYGLSVGDVVTLVEDDNSCIPIYKDKQGDDICLYNYEVEKIDNISEIKKLQEEQIAQSLLFTLTDMFTSLADYRNIKRSWIAENIDAENATTKQSDTCSLHSLLQDFHKGHDVAAVLTRDGYSLEFDNYTFSDLTLEKLTDKLELLKKLFPNE